MAGINRLACITIAVKDQDEALQRFTQKPGFHQRVDRPGSSIRFLTVSPPKQPELQVILASWLPEHSGKNPTAVLCSDDCRSTCDELRKGGVMFTQGPQQRPYGLQAVFKDLYRNSYAALPPGASHD